MPTSWAIWRSSLRFAPLLMRSRHRVIGDEQFVNADSPGETKIAATRTAALAEKFCFGDLEFFELALFVERWFVFFLAILAELSHQSLSKHASNGYAVDEIRFDAEIEQSGNRAGRIVRVQGAEH